MNKTEKTIAGLIIVGLFATITMLFNLGSVKVNVGGMSQTVGRFSSLGSTGTSTEVLVTTTSAQLVATSSAREYVEISNLSASPIFCNANGDATAVVYRGITIPALGTKVFGQDLAYTGAIRCVGTANASTTVYAKQ